MGRSREPVATRMQRFALLCRMSEADIKLAGRYARFMRRHLRAQKRAALKKEREDRSGFEARNFQRWKRGFDALEFFCGVAHEVGSAFNTTFRSEVKAQQDHRFEALTHLHARAILVTEEVLCLLRGGFPDGALARWRSLHEIAVHARAWTSYRLSSA